MTEHAPPWPKQGPASYFPSIEKKYGRSIVEWQEIIARSGLEQHMAIVNHLKSEYGMGHGHANALVGWTLAGTSRRAERPPGLLARQRMRVVPGACPGCAGLSVPLPPAGARKNATE